MISDESQIYDLVARFDDSVNRRDVDQFKALWAEDSVWEIGDPMPLAVSGATPVADAWLGLMASTEWLFRGSFAGVVQVNGDVATGRWPCVETGAFTDGRGYDNRAYYTDTYLKGASGWLFQRRHYTYLWLSTETLPGAPVRSAVHA